MTYTTDVEAYEALAKVKATKADILAFVRQLSVDVGLPSGTETVLYTGKIGDTDAYKFVNDMPDTVRKLDDRALATRVLKSDEFIKKVAQAFGEIPNAQVFKDLPDTNPAKLWMKEGGKTPWGVASEMFVNETTGPIRFLALDPDPKSVLVKNSNLDQQTAEHFAQTINRLKGKVTMIFITHQVPKGLQVDEVVNMGQHAMSMHVVSTAS